MIFLEIIGVVFMVILLVDHLEREYVERHRWAARRIIREMAWQAVEDLKYEL